MARIFDLDSLTAADLDELAYLKRDEEDRAGDERTARLHRGESEWERDNRRLTEQSDPRTNAVVDEIVAKQSDPLVNVPVNVAIDETATADGNASVLADDLTKAGETADPAVDHRPRPAPAQSAPLGPWPPMPRSDNRWEPFQLLAVAVDLVDLREADGEGSLPHRQVEDEYILAGFAAAHGLGDDALADALMVYRAET